MKKIIFVAAFLLLAAFVLAHGCGSGKKRPIQAAPAVEETPAPAPAAKRILVTLRDRNGKCQLQAFRGKQEEFSFPCSAGRPEQPTPTGRFTVAGKLIQEIREGDLDRVSFGAFIVLQDETGTIVSTGVLGWPQHLSTGQPTIDPKLIGEPVSVGSVFLRRQDFCDLFVWVADGTLVLIRASADDPPFEVGSRRILFSLTRIPPHPYHLICCLVLFVRIRPGNKNVSAAQTAQAI